MADAPVFVWGQAEIVWEPEAGIDAIRFQVAGFFERLTAMLAAERLQSEVMSISKGSGTLDIEIMPGEKTTTPKMADFEPGHIAVIADNFMDRFDAAELRQVIQSVMDEAQAEAEEISTRNTESARAFLKALHEADPS